MVMDNKQFELNRIVDMIKTRNYEIISSSIKDDKVVIEAEKKITPELATTKELESTWITNFLKSFGWDVEYTSFLENRIAIKFFKEVKVIVP